MEIKLRLPGVRQSRLLFLSFLLLVFFFFSANVGAEIPLQKYVGMIILSCKHMVGMMNTLFYYFSFFYW